MIKQVLRHLSHGWQGFVGILSDATAAGCKLPQEEVERLERMQIELTEIIRKQKALTDGR